MSLLGIENYCKFCHFRTIFPIERNNDANAFSTMGYCLFYSMFYPQLHPPRLSIILTIVATIPNKAQ